MGKIHLAEGKGEGVSIFGQVQFPYLGNENTSLSSCGPASRDSQSFLLYLVGRLFRSSRFGWLLKFGRGDPTGRGYRHTTSLFSQT